MFNIVDKVKGIKDTVASKVADKKKSLGSNDVIDTSNNPLRDFSAFKVVGEGYFPIKEYVDFDKPVDIHKLPIGVKEDKSAGLVTIDAHQDNFLVAGVSGSGKSVIVRAVVSQLAKTNAIIYGIDLKQTELYVFEDRFTAIATEPNETTVLIDGLIEEVEHRLNYIKDSGKTEIDSDDATHPPIVLIIDEYAEIAGPLDYTEAEAKRVEEVKGKIATLTKLSHLTGLSVFIFTQAPKKEYLTDEVLENIDNRIGLFTSTKAQLKAIIGESAELIELTKKTEQAGYFVKGNDDPIKFKPLYISDKECEEINDTTKDNKKILNTKSMKKFNTIAWENFVHSLVDLSDDGQDKMIHTKNIIDLAHDISLEDGKVIRNYILNSDIYSKIMAEHYKGEKSLDLFLIDFDRRVDIAAEEKENN